MVLSLDPKTRRTSRSRRFERGGEFTEILTFSFFGLAMSLLAVGQGWTAPVEWLTRLLLFIQ